MNNLLQRLSDRTGQLYMLVDEDEGFTLYIDHQFACHLTSERDMWLRLNDMLYQTF